MNRIQDLREERGLSLQQLSNAIEEQTGKKISKASLSNYEREDQQPKKDTWKILSDFFHVNLSYIMGLSSSRNAIEERFYKTDISRLVELTSGDLSNGPQIRKIVRTLTMLLVNAQDHKEYLKRLYELLISIETLNPYPDNDSVSIDFETGDMRSDFEVAKFINENRLKIESSLNYFVSLSLDRLLLNQKHKKRHERVSKDYFGNDENAKMSDQDFLDFDKKLEAFNKKSEILDEDNFNKVNPDKDKK